MLGHGASIVRDGLVLHLDAANPKSYPGSGITWYDLSGNGNHFILINGPTYIDKTLVFDGVNDYATNSSRNWLINNITIEIVAKSYVSGMLASSLHYVSPDHNGWRFEPDGARTWHSLYPEYTFRWGQLNPEWNCFIYSHSTNGGYSFLNNKLTASVSTAYTWNTSYNRMDIGRYTLQNNNYLNGSISSIRIYDRVLSTQEIQQNFEALRGRYGI